MEQRCTAVRSDTDIVVINATTSVNKEITYVYWIRSSIVYDMYIIRYTDEMQLCKCLNLHSKGIPIQFFYNFGMPFPKGKRKN